MQIIDKIVFLVYIASSIPLFHICTTVKRSSGMSIFREDPVESQVETLLQHRCKVVTDDWCLSCLLMHGSGSPQLTEDESADRATWVQLSLKALVGEEVAKQLMDQLWHECIRGNEFVTAVANSIKKMEAPPSMEQWKKAADPKHLKILRALGEF